MKNRSRRFVSSSKSSGARFESCERRQLLSTYVVNTLSDATNPGTGLLTLRQAVADANLHSGADSITFDPKVFAPSSLHTVTLTQGPITFSDKTGTTTVTGPGATVAAVSGNSKSRVFNINAGSTVAISGLTITGGRQTTTDANGNVSGGGIDNAGTLTISNSTVTGNTTVAPTLGEPSYEKKIPAQAGTASGGGIVSTGPLTINNSTLSSNTATGGSGYYGGAAFGGAVVCSSTLVLNGDTITKNTANGGPAADFGQTGATASGGAIDATGTLTVTNCTVTGNTANGGHSVDSYSSGASGAALGGGLFGAVAVTITGSTITGNSATGGYSGLDSGTAGVAQGGGVYAGGTLTISSSTVTGNSANVLGEYNSNLSGGGGVFAAGNATVILTTIDNNTVVGGPPELISLENTNITSAGGGIYVGGTISLAESTVSGNTANTEYPAFYQAGGSCAGGGVYAGKGGSIVSSTVANNSETASRGYGDSSRNYQPEPGGNAQGAGINSGGILTVTNSTITANTAVAGAGGDQGAAGHDGANGGDSSGGGIFASTLVIADSTITANSVTAGPGGLGNSDGYVNGAGGTASGGGVKATSLTLTNSIVSVNKAGGVFSDITGNASSSSGFNIVGIGGGLTNGVNGNHVGITNPDLSPLGEYGGPTLTMVPLSGSPAIDAGSNALVSPIAIDDQRGLARIFNSTVDIGAVEVQPKVQALSGKIIGTAGSFNNHGTTIANVFDQNLSTYFDAPTASGSYVGLDLGTAQVVSQISYSPRIGWAPRMVGGIFQASNSANFSAGVVTLYTITVKPAPSVMTTVSIANKTAYRYIRYTGPANSYCDIAEMQLFTPSTTPGELPGTVIGTVGSYRNHGTTIANVFDENLNTYFDGPNASGDWVGEAFAAPVVVTQVKFSARVGYETRMVGGMIQASNTADFSSGVVTLKTITYPPPSGSLKTVTLPNTTAYRYYRYIGPTNSYCDIAELEFLG
jgi:hypothetical protein